MECDFGVVEVGHGVGAVVDAMSLERALRNLIVAESLVDRSISSWWWG